MHSVIVSRLFYIIFYQTFRNIKCGWVSNVILNDTDQLETRLKIYLSPEYSCTVCYIISNGVSLLRFPLHTNVLSVADHICVVMGSIKLSLCEIELYCVQWCVVIVTKNMMSNQSILIRYSKWEMIKI